MKIQLFCFYFVTLRKSIGLSMENYIVSARKYRPATFDTVVGQSALTVTLKNAIRSGKLAHAYLFCGPRGVGKTTCARIFAKTINCLHPQENGEACNECESCMAFNEQRSYNIHELDAASNNSVDEIRQLIEQVRIPPQVGKYKVFIIDEVHMLSTAAFNAFLKTLEEPPRHVIFILATTEKHKILPTILSRCQIYDFNRMSVSDIVRHLEYVAQQEGVSAEPEALNVIAQKADGGMRDALSIFDQVVSYTGGNLVYDQVIRNLNVLDYEYYFKVVDDFLANKVKEVMLLFNDILNKGFQGDHFITGLSRHLRDLLVSRDAVTLPLLEVGESVRQRYQEQAARCEERFLYAAMKLCNDCDLNYRASKNKRLLVELTLIQCAQLTQEDEGASCGLRPTRKIKPLFQQQPVATVTPAASRPVTPVVEEKIPESQTSEPAVNPLTLNKQVQNKPLPKLKIGQIGFSIRDPHRGNTQQVVENPQQQAAREAVERLQQEQKAVTAENLRFFWNEYIQLLPREEAAMRGRMEMMNPLLTGPEEFEVVVENKQVAADLESIRTRVEAHLQQGIGNYRLRMKVRIAAPGEVRRAFSPLERFKQMCEKNHALKRLQEELGLDVR